MVGDSSPLLRLGTKYTEAGPRSRWVCVLLRFPCNTHCPYNSGGVDTALRRYRELEKNGLLMRQEEVRILLGGPGGLAH